MNKKSFYSRALAAKVCIVLCLTFFCASLTDAQNNSFGKDLAAQRAEAIKLVGENRYLDALPILEKIAPLLPDDAEIWADYGIAVLSNTAVLKSPEMRQKERKRGREILLKAKQLGTKNVLALNFIDQIAPDGSGDDNLSAENPAVESALREGEGFFGRAEYDKAFTAYEKAYKINPRNYEAVLFMGDSLYAQKKYKESEVWFAKAASLEPNREAAFRYWGDALMSQNKPLEARDKFVEALIAEPFSNLTLDRLGRWLDETDAKFSPVEIVPPGNETTGELKIDEKMLKAEDGTIHWKLYSDTRKAQILEFSGKNQRHTLAREAIAWRKVADAARRDIKSGKLKTPDQSLQNLIKMDDAGVLEAYILLKRPHEDFGEDFLAYRDANRAKFRLFIIEYLIGLKS